MVGYHSIVHSLRVSNSMLHWKGDRTIEYKTIEYVQQYSQIWRIFNGTILDRTYSHCSAVSQCQHSQSVGMVHTDTHNSSLVITRHGIDMYLFHLFVNCRIIHTRQFPTLTGKLSDKCFAPYIINILEMCSIRFQYRLWSFNRFRRSYDTTGLGNGYCLSGP